MNINDMTIGQAREIAQMIGNRQEVVPGLDDMVGSKCIIRTYSAGAWFGEVAQKRGNEVIVTNARRLWRWKAAEGISLSAVATYGVERENCKFAPVVSQVWLEAIELIPATDGAIKSIEETPDAVAG